jgi:succinate-acetate transporter protein
MAPRTAPPGLAPASVVLRPLGSPLPLGFLALAVATFVFACLQLDWIAPTNGKQVALAALVFTAPLQILTSALAFAARDSAVGTGMGVLAGTWAVVGLVTLGLPPGSTNDGLGVVLLAAGACLLVPAAAALPGLLAPSVIGLSAVRFAVTGVAELTGTTDWLRVAGWVGLALAAWAFVVALVLLVKRSETDLADEPGIRAGV